MKQLSISVVLPAYNEQDNLALAVKSVYRYLKGHFSRFEMIVVDDGSRDQTPRIVLQLARKIPQLRLVRHNRNLGYGAALKSGFARASGSLVFYTDSDCQYDISDLDKLLPLAQNYDIVAGFRKRRQDPLMRIFIGWVYNLLVWTVFGLKVKDVDCSFKLYRHQVFKAIRLTCQTGLIDAEILLKARRAGFTLTQVPVNHYPRTRGATMYEMGQRNKILAFVRPQVIWDLLVEMKKLKRTL